MHIISAEWLHARLADVKIIDASFSLADPDLGTQQFLAGHIPGASYVHLEHGLSDMRAVASLGRHPLPNASDFARVLDSCGIRATDTVVCYDQDNAAYAARTWWLLRAAGFQNVHVLDGGLSAWKAAGFCLATDVAPILGGTANASLAFTAMPQIDSDQLQIGLANHSRVLIDARPANRFAGRDETLDPIAGHVPGARNRPFSENLSAGRFKTGAQLRSEFQALLAGCPPADVVMMCGSGVTACHNLLAMAAAGLDGGALYAPSWSGWIIDARRPIAQSNAC
jgi:thiosulfate/3-mercaptopyruvate sulfurtransferase